MKNNTTRKLTIAGLSAALITVFTLVQIPTGIAQGYINLGDLAIVACAFVLPEYWFCAAAAGIGSALADIISGFAIYAPATFIIKAALGILAVLAVKKLDGKRVLQMVLLLVVSLVVPVGYFLYECLLKYGVAVAFSDAIFNSAQAAIGTFVGGIFGNIVSGLIKTGRQ